MRAPSATEARLLETIITEMAHATVLRTREDEDGIGRGISDITYRATQVILVGIERHDQPVVGTRKREWERAGGLRDRNGCVHEARGMPVRALVCVLV